MKPHQMSASKAVASIREGALSAEALSVDCLHRIDAREPQVRAWTHLDRDHVVAQAKAADAKQREGNNLGPLHGTPVAIKDIFDTSDYPTEWGSTLLKGRQPVEDSAVVSLLRKAGAIILGKTVTTEFASFAPGPTCNPHDLSRTPGGSSSGSAAAVADCMIPLALGSQTAGSTIRPGSFCGTVAFKPQFGAISRYGCMTLSSALDHVGLYARTVEDIALLAEVLYGQDARDSAAGSVNLSGVSTTLKDSNASKLRLGFAATPFWERMEPGAIHAFESYVVELGVERVDLPADFRHAADALNTICDVEVAQHFADLYREGADQFSAEFRQEYEHGCRILALAYVDALKLQEALRLDVDKILGRYDALVTPAALGEAPVGLDSTGDPIFCSPWTLIGNPTICLPLLKGSDDLPIGVQLVGERCGDAKLMKSRRSSFQPW